MHKTTKISLAKPFKVLAFLGFGKASGHGRRLAPLIERNRERIKALAEANGVCNVRVFGSMAKGAASPQSDIDLLVDLQQGKTGLALGGFLVDVSDLTRRKVDVVTEKSLHPSLKDKILNEAVHL